MNSPDHDLYERFADQRARDITRAPSFERVIARRRRSAPSLRLVPAMALAATAVFAIVGVWRRSVDPDNAGPFAIVPGVLRVPTDFLLDMSPGIRLGEVPSLGVNDWFPLAPTSAGAANAARKDS